MTQMQVPVNFWVMYCEPFNVERTGTSFGGYLGLFCVLLGLFCGYPGPFGCFRVLFGG